MTASSYTPDVFVVGGGPAGLAAALSMRRHGLRVLVADCAQPPIDKACGEGLMPDAERVLASLGVTLAGLDTCVLHGIRFIGGRDEAEARFSQGAGIGIRRLQLHRRMVDAAVAAGVDFVWRARITFAGPRVCVDGVPVCSRWIVGADGQKSQLRQWAGITAASTGARRVGLRRHYRVAPWSDVVEVYWGERMQAYVTPVGAREVCVAILASGPVTSFEAAIAGFPALQRRLAKASFASAVRGAVTQSRRLRTATRNYLALVGDASGSVDAITGEGLTLSFRQALALGDALAAGDLASYEQAHRDIMRLPMFMGRALLLLDKAAWVRRRALRVFAKEPALLSRLLSVHVGDLPLTRFAQGSLLSFGWQFLTA